MFMLAVLFSAFFLRYTCAQNYSNDAVALSDEILANCPNVNPISYSPSCVLGRSRTKNACNTTTISLGLWLERFHEIDDIKETLSFSGSVHFYWNITCPNKYRLWHDDLTFYIDEKLFWMPRIYHQNAVDDYGMQFGFATRFCADGLPVADKVNSVNFYLQRSGVFASSCNMDYANFPFDEQVLIVMFLVREKTKAATFSELDMVESAADFMPDGTVWTFVSINYTITTRYIIGSYRSVFIFHLGFKRKPDFYVYNLMLPTCVLSGLELGSFLMPPHLPDRPTFTMAILLALTFMEGEILARVPPKPQRIFLMNYTAFCALFAWGVTLYTLFSICAIRMQAWKNWLSKSLGPREPFKLQRIRVIDTLAFLISLAFFAGINGYAFNMMKVYNFA